MGQRLTLDGLTFSNFPVSPVAMSPVNHFLYPVMIVAGWLLSVTFCPADQPVTLSELPTPAQSALKEQVARWKATVARYESEPDTNEGRKELSAGAIAHGKKREVARSAYHMFEYGAAAFQLAIVLASAAAVTSVMWLAFIGAGIVLVSLLAIARMGRVATV